MVVGVAGHAEPEARLAGCLVQSRSSLGLSGALMLNFRLVAVLNFDPTMENLYLLVVMAPDSPLVPDHLHLDSLNVAIASLGSDNLGSSSELLCLIL
eukprot:SAG31_NODE_31876_length_363_cov_0.583333_1_plen_97_part_00